MHPSSRAVNSGSGNWALGWLMYGTSVESSQGDEGGVWYSFLSVTAFSVWYIWEQIVVTAVMIWHL